MKKVVKKIFQRVGFKIEKLNSTHDVHVDAPARFIPYQQKFLGHILYIHDSLSFSLGEWELFKNNTYKFFTTNKSPYIIDCGSNIGMSIIYFKQLYPQSEILAFEADTYIYSFLEKNIASFNISNIKAINKAVWDCEDQAISFMPDGGAGGKILEETKSGDCQTVSTARLKNYIIRDIDFLKIDIEGAEFQVLKDCADNLMFVKNLFIEYHSMPDEKQHLHEILEIIQTAGFRYHIKESYTVKLPFIERPLNCGMDLQLNIFCYRNISQ